MTKLIFFILTIFCTNCYTMHKSSSCSDLEKLLNKISSENTEKTSQELIDEKIAQLIKKLDPLILLHYKATHAKLDIEKHFAKLKLRLQNFQSQITIEQNFFLVTLLAIFHNNIQYFSSSKDFIITSTDNLINYLNLYLCHEDGIFPSEHLFPYEDFPQTHTAWNEKFSKTLKQV